MNCAKIALAAAVGADPNGKGRAITGRTGARGLGLCELKVVRRLKEIH